LERIMTQVHNGIVMVEKDLMDPNRATVDEVQRQPPSLDELPPIGTTEFERKDVEAEQAAIRQRAG
jgi:hypothetical protein